MNHRPSEELLFLMEKINLAPINDPEIQDSYLLFEIKYIDATGAGFSEFGKYDEKLVNQLLKEIFEEIRKHLTQHYPALLDHIDEEVSHFKDIYITTTREDDDVEAFLHVWNQYVAARNKFLHIIRTIKRSFTAQQVQGIWTPLRSISRGLDIVWEIRDEHLLKIKGDLVDRALDGVDIRRIRFCRYCRRLFWAYRLDNYTCSKKCGQNVRTQKHREKQQNRFRSRVKKDVAE